MKKTKLLLFGAVVVLLAAGLSVLYQMRPAREGSDADYIRLFGDVMTLVKTRYVEPVDDKKLIRGAINGMLASLDPHSAYMPPEPFQEMQISTAGSFGGLGIEITIADRKLTVISPIEDTPAFRAGIKAGDHIVKIDGKFTGDMNINQAVKLMRGPKGTAVTLTIGRKEFPAPRPYTITRDIILVKSVRARTLEPGIGYVRIAQFQERTGKDFAEVLAKLHKENGGKMKGLVLDLRNNPGGLLDQAVKVAEQFLGDKLDNGLVVFTRGRTESSRRDLNASVGDKQPAYPMVVLINSGSASASEIVAGALQDHHRAVIMGTQSFGKGSVQSIIPLRHDAGLLLTTARYYTPSGRSIQAKGISPDIVVDNADFTLSKTNSEGEIREKDLENHIEGAPPPPHSASPLKPTTGKSEKDLSKSDYQLVRAVDLLKGWEIISKFR